MSQPVSFALGDVVEIFGLESEKGKELNGQSGVIVARNPDNGRLEVRFNQDKTSAVNPANLKKAIDSVSPPQKAGADDGKAPDPYAGVLFATGDCVECVGLESEAGKDLNGKNGMVCKHVESTDRFEVRFALGPPKYDYKLCMMKACNLRKIRKVPPGCKPRPQNAGKGCSKGGGRGGGRMGGGPGVQWNHGGSSDSGTLPEKVYGGNKPMGGGYPERPKGGLPTADADEPSSGALFRPGGFGVGDRVEVEGLTSEAGMKLNGQQGDVSRVGCEKGRIEVQFPEGRNSLLKMANLKRLNLVIGDMVEVTGLTSDVGKQWNGWKGLIEKYNDDSGRYEVKLPPEKIMSFKVANLVRTERRGEPEPPKPEKKKATDHTNWI